MAAKMYELLVTLSHNRDFICGLDRSDIGFDTNSSQPDADVGAKTTTRDARDTSGSRVMGFRRQG